MWKGFLLFFAYLLSARMGLSLSAVSGFATLVWLPTGIAFAALLLWGKRYWPAVALAAISVNLWTGAPVLVALGMGIGNTLEAVIGVTLFRRFAGVDTRLDNIRHVTVLVVCVGLISTMFSATIGVGSLYLGQMVKSDGLLSTWWAWWIGDVLSALVVAPLLIVWSRPPVFEKSFSRRIEGLVLGFLVIALSLAVFSPWPFRDLHQYIQLYWVFLLLIWATLRFGQHANVLLTMVLSTIAIIGTLMGHGPYYGSTVSENLLLLQLFMSAVALSGLFFGALGREKDDAIRLRTDFISIASHELRTPVTGINISIDVLKGLGIHENPNVGSAMDSLERQTKKLSTLVESLLNVAQIESGNLILEKKETDISELVHRVADNLKELRERKGCELNLEIQPLVRGVVSPYGIEQVLTNLVMNSLKYGQGKPITITLAETGTGATLSVQDHGQGIAPGNHQRIFERYERVKSETNQQGVGLGLYLSKLIVNAHQGKISVQSQEGKGSIFTVEIPRAPEDA